MSRERRHLITLPTGTATREPPSVDVLFDVSRESLFSGEFFLCAGTVEQPYVRGKVPFGCYVLPLHH